MLAAHAATLAHSEPGPSAVIWPLCEMTVGAQLQRGSLNRFHPMIVSSSCADGDVGWGMERACGESCVAVVEHAERHSTLSLIQSLTLTLIYHIDTAFGSRSFGDHAVTANMAIRVLEVKK